MRAIFPFIHPLQLNIGDNITNCTGFNFLMSEEKHFVQAMVAINSRASKELLDVITLELARRRKHELLFEVIGHMAQDKASIESTQMKVRQLHFERHCRVHLMQLSKVDPSRRMTISLFHCVSVTVLSTIPGPKSGEWFANGGRQQ